MDNERDYKSQFSSNLTGEQSAVVEMGAKIFQGARCIQAMLEENNPDLTLIIHWGEEIASYAMALKQLGTLQSIPRENGDSIDWENIPPEYMWAAKNADGRWFVYTEKPSTPNPMSEEWGCPASANATKVDGPQGPLFWNNSLHTRKG